ncbi:MAG: hypothetical protein MUO53_12330 [Maribacter sp.]|nr:hypothetical protein [Maribacter sp.]
MGSDVITRSGSDVVICFFGTLIQGIGGRNDVFALSDNQQAVNNDKNKEKRRKKTQ